MLCPKWRRQCQNINVHCGSTGEWVGKKGLYSCLIVENLSMSTDRSICGTFSVTKFLSPKRRRIYQFEILTMKLQIFQINLIRTLIAPL